MGEGCCGLHLCGKCGIAVLVFGLLFLLEGLKVIAVGPWVILGVFMALMGLMALLMGGKK